MKKSFFFFFSMNVWISKALTLLDETSYIILVVKEAVIHSTKNWRDAFHTGKCVVECVVTNMREKKLTVTLNCRHQWHTACLYF